jgi:SSS family solute:Na+ symporter
MYPHTVTSVLASANGRVIRRNAVLLPAYTLLLGLIAILGIVAVAAGLHITENKQAIPALLASSFPHWFTGFCFAGISIAALVPAAIMSIAAANLFTRNLYLEYLKPHASEREQTQVAKRASLVVELGALLFVLAFPTRYAVNLQLLGGIWILQTFPAIALGLWGRWFHQRALLIGWMGGMLLGTHLSYV